MEDTLYKVANRHMLDQYDEIAWAQEGPLQNGPFDSVDHIIDDFDSCAKIVLEGNEDHPAWDGDIDQLASAGTDPDFLQACIEQIDQPELEAELESRLLIAKLKQ